MVTAVAHLVEHRTCNSNVVGSVPTGTNYIFAHYNLFAFMSHLLPLS